MRGCRSSSAASRTRAAMEGEMLKGHLDMIVLAALSAGPAHGYAGIEEIKRRSAGSFDHPASMVCTVRVGLEQAGVLGYRWRSPYAGTRQRVHDGTPRGQPQVPLPSDA